MDFLLERPTNPLEREFEAWLADGIRAYFKSVGVQARVWAIGPRQESLWPADQALLAEGKLVGFQVKRPTIAAPRGKGNDFSRISWRLDDPADQRYLIAKTSEILYALPLFANQDIRLSALHHFVFWRPNVRTYRRISWQASSNKAGGPPQMRTAGRRWGEVAEGIFACTLGRILTRDEAPAYLQKLQIAAQGWLEQETIVVAYVDIRQGTTA